MISDSFAVQLPKIPEREYRIEAYGAVSGGLASNTRAIRLAFEDAAENGGGRVTVPRGIWLTGPIRLLSNTELHLEEGSLLLFDKNPEEYPVILTQYEGMDRVRCVSPISADHAENIAVTGSGTIDGSGQLWRPAKQFKFPAREWRRLKNSSPDTVAATEEGELWFPTTSAYEGYRKGEPDMSLDPALLLASAAPYYDFFRPVMVSLIHCSKILIEGVTLQNSPAWNVHPLFCDNITIRHAAIRNPYFAQNGDGLDLESCRLAEIHHVTFDVGDDAICMKSGRNAPARRIDFPTEEVYIHDCTVYHGHGGFSVGSEMSRGVRSILVENCTFIGTDTGIRFKSSPGRGGVIENITIRSIRMIRIVNEAILFTLGYVHRVLGSHDTAEKAKTASTPEQLGGPVPQKEGNIIYPPEDIPEIRGITLSDITCAGAGTAIKIEGLAVSPVRSITFNRITLAAQRLCAIENAENIVFNEVTLHNTISGETDSYSQPTVIA